MKEIQLTQGKVTLVDDEDYERYCNYKWHYMNIGYASRKDYPEGRYKQKIVYLHREIMKCPDGMEVDHINRNRLDNQKYNLRIVTRSQNQVNKVQTPNTGVYLTKGKYVARLRVNKNQIQLGSFTTIPEARQAYIDGVKRYYGIDLT